MNHDHVVFITRDGCEATAVIPTGMSARIERRMARPAPKWDDDSKEPKLQDLIPVRTYERTSERRPGGVIVYREIAKEASALDLMRKLTDEQRLSVMNQFCKHCGRHDPRCQCWNDE